MATLPSEDYSSVDIENENESGCIEALVSKVVATRARPWRIKLIAGKRHHVPITALVAVLVIAVFLLYTGMHRFHAVAPVPQPLHDKK
jgi:phosphotransferase system  glucose/maltose/N-acetylglucosamine-specific IIC component